MIQLKRQHTSMPCQTGGSTESSSQYIYNWVKKSQPRQTFIRNNEEASKIGETFFYNLKLYIMW